MSLNPSNLIAANDNPGKTMFPNLARINRQLNSAKEIGDWAVICGEVDACVLRELASAGIKASEPFESFRKRGEVPTAHMGTFCKWGFTRAWYYWIAEGPGIPPDKAEEFHKAWGQQVRVDGHCGCPSPLEWHHGFAVGCYHIDTQEGLNAFAELLRSIYKP